MGAFESAPICLGVTDATRLAHGWGNGRSMIAAPFNTGLKAAHDAVRTGVNSIPARRSTIFAGRRGGTGAVRLAYVAGLRRILSDVVPRIFSLIGSDRVQLIRLLGIDRLRRALSRASRQQGDPCDGNNEQIIPHFYAPPSGFRVNARARVWDAMLIPD